LLREAEVLLAQGETVPKVSRRLGVTELTNYLWRKEYGGMRVSQAVNTMLEEKQLRTGHVSRLNESDNCGPSKGTIVRSSMNHDT
jgi:transposase-like protein